MNDTCGIDLWFGLTALGDFRESIPGALRQAGMNRASGPLRTARAAEPASKPNESANHTGPAHSGPPGTARAAEPASRPSAPMA